MRPRHTPHRTCVACRTTGDKRGLLRVVRNPQGSVEFDPGGKASGRGAYVCASESCIRQAQKQKKLDRSLKSQVTEEIYASLLERAALTESPEST